MREGLDGDDKYIMVEDEFHAVAKTFTNHLHHAEYVRLKQLAKSQNASKIHTISRPVDPRTEMREDTKRAKSQETKSRLQKNAVRDMLLASGDADESDPDLATHEDPWAGTSLQGLMASPKRAERSLAAISAIRSSTRAAAGFTKGTSAAEPTSRLAYQAMKDPISGFASARSLLQGGAAASEDDSGDDDDLDAPAHVKAEDSAPQAISQGAYNRLRGGRPENLHVKNDPSPKRNMDGYKEDVSRAWPNASSSSSSGKASYSFLPKPTALPGEALQISAKRKAKLKAEKASTDHKNENTSSIFDEIPTFLV
ncbi:MAG: hypothetical protein M1839_003480 [Geoglossum umbratile]|nr:MAG: hypothetical protein M1839_003480 [Geoglossum umbratile]